MNSESSQLPWDELQRTEGGVPWLALHAIADAVVADREVTRELFEVYDQAYEAVDYTAYADLYVPAIFTLAAPRLDSERRREIGSFLVERLVRAGEDDSDVSMEVLQAAAGTLGPVILPAVLDAIAKEPDADGAWLYLWTLTTLAAKADDPDLRSRVVQACVNLLERADRGQIDLMDAAPAAWTLALLGGTEYTGLLQRLHERTLDTGWGGEYRDALKLLQNRLDFTRPKELWEEPVEKWLTSRCRMAEEGAAESDAYEEEPDENEAKDDPFETYAQLMTRSFVTSPVAAGLPPELLSSAHLIVHDLVYPSLKYLQKQPRDWDEATLREILLDFVPRDLPADRKMLSKIVPITEAFLYWLGSEGTLADADELGATVHQWSDQIIAAGMDPKNWGPVKTFLMEARKAGADAMNKTRVMEFFNRQLTEFAETVGSLSEPAEPAPQPKKELPIPIVEHSPRVARNAPCPCGSGKNTKNATADPTPNRPRPHESAGGQRTRQQEEIVILRRAAGTRRRAKTRTEDGRNQPSLSHRLTSSPSCLHTLRLSVSARVDDVVDSGKRTVTR
ncbi:MAG: SEC-C domain-containing protein [Phycisphaerae bacterium]|nr:SEC-C domain-containing protein [Phycisphaerae bacterium]